MSRQTHSLPACRQKLSGASSRQPLRSGKGACDHLGIDLARIRYVARKASADGIVRCLLAGRAIEKKGLIYGLRAFARRGERRNWVFPLVCVLLAFTALGGLYEPTEKGYLKKAGLWIKHNTPPQATLFSNDPLILWYSRRGGNERPARYAWDQVLEVARTHPLPQYDYLAVRMKATESEQEQQLIDVLGRPPGGAFVNPNGDKALVFALR